MVLLLYQNVTKPPRPWLCHRKATLGISGDMMLLWLLSSYCPSGSRLTSSKLLLLDPTSLPSLLLGATTQLRVLGSLTHEDNIPATKMLNIKKAESQQVMTHQFALKCGTVI